MNVYTNMLYIYKLLLYFLYLIKYIINIKSLLEYTFKKIKMFSHEINVLIYSLYTAIATVMGISVSLIITPALLTSSRNELGLGTPVWNTLLRFIGYEKDPRIVTII